MLGIDIQRDQVRIVSLKRRGNVFTWLDAAQVPLVESAWEHPQQIAGLINEALDQHGWKHQRASVVLDRRHYLVKRVAAPPVLLGNRSFSRGAVDQILEHVQQSMLVSLDQLTFDFWVQTTPVEISPVTMPTDILVAGADKKQVDFYTVLASHLNLKIVNMELAPLAAINGLLFNWLPYHADNLGVAYWLGFGKRIMKPIYAAGKRLRSWMARAEAIRGFPD